jgi:hypothetical protein
MRRWDSENRNQKLGGGGVCEGVEGVQTSVTRGTV